MKDKKEKFTPGPWKMVMHDDDPAYIYARKKYIAKINTKEQDDFCFSRPKAEANAHLIAASPLLFDKLSVALERLKEKSDGSYRDLGLIQSIEKTLNKATGDA